MGQVTSAGSRSLATSTTSGGQSTASSAKGSTTHACRPPRLPKRPQHGGQRDRHERRPRRRPADHLLPQSVHDIGRTGIYRLQGVSCVDLVNNLIYNWESHAATGNPHSANSWATGSARGPRVATHDWWLPQRSSVAPHLYSHTSVFTRGNKLDGFTGRRRANPVVYATTARCGGLSVHASPVATVYNSVLTNVGARLPGGRQRGSARHLRRAESGRKVFQRRRLQPATPVLASAGRASSRSSVGGSESHVGPAAHVPRRRSHLAQRLGHPQIHDGHRDAVVARARVMPNGGLSQRSEVESLRHQE